MAFNFPLVSVIIPAYNAEDYISETLSSVLAQTYKNIEILVIDDGSQDKTSQIVKSFAEGNSNIILLQQSNKGVAAARNLGIEKAQGEYIAPIDADDIWFPEKLEKQVLVMLNSDSLVGVVYAWSVYMQENSSLTECCQISYFEGNIYIPLIYGNWLGNASSALIRRSCINRVGGYNCELKERKAQGCEDWDFYLRLAEHYEFRVIPEILIGYRHLIGSMSFNDVAMKKSFEIVFNDIKRRYPEIPDNICRWSISKFNWDLATRSSQGGEYVKSIFYQYKAGKFDRLLLLNPNFYERLIKSVLKLVAKPVAYLIWQDHRSWLKFKRKFKASKQVIDISELNKMYSKDNRQNPAREYIDMITERCEQVERQWKHSPRLAELNTDTHQVSYLANK